MRLAAAPDCAICVPARDERRRLPALLDALADQHGAVSAALCILFDGCEDGGEDIVRRLAPRMPFPVVTRRLQRMNDASAGRARSAAMALGQGVVGRNGLLLTTDADTVPDPDWLIRSIEALDRVHLVAGRIRRLDPGRLPQRCRHEAYLDRLHALRRTVDPIPYDPAPSHPGLGGASLGLRAGAYRMLGGFRALGSGEDADLVLRARAEGCRVSHDPRVQVATSARTTGRAPNGLAAELRALVTGHALPRVPDPFEALQNYERQAQARRAFPVITRCERTLGALAEVTGLPRRELLLLGCRARTADAFVTQLWHERPDVALIPLDRAEPMLSELERRLREEAA